MTDTQHERIVDRLRKQEYTGHNRCVPCTIANVLIAGVISGAISVVSLPFGGVSFVVFLSLIYLRGYLIPYTPELTKRYVPDRVLRLFDKHPSDPWETDEGGLIDVEATLRSMGIIRQCDSIDDLCLEESFRERWKTRMNAVERAEDRITEIASLLGVDVEKISIESFGSAVAVHYENQKVGQWESDPALSADIAADGVLNDLRPEWTEIDPVNRGRVLSSLRMFLEECPSCGGTARLQQETVESCCRSMEVAAVSCDECQARLFEVELESIQESH